MRKFLLSQDVYKRQEAEEAKQIFRKQFEKNQRLVHLYKQNMFMVFRMEGIRDYQMCIRDSICIEYGDLAKW